MPVGVKTPPEVEARVVEMARSGASRNAVRKATGLHTSTITRIVTAAGVEWAKITGGGSNGTAEAMAKARGVQSQYARNRRSALADRTLDEYERTLDLMKVEMRPRERSLLAQALSHSSKAYADITAQDAKSAPDMSHIQSTFSILLAGLSMKQIEVPPDQGTFES